MEISIVIPTFNEKNNIGKLLHKISELSSKCFFIEVIIVDDDSKDGTIDTIENYIQQSENHFLEIKLHKRKDKKGLSSAILDGVGLSSHEYVVVMDADLSHPPEIIKKMCTLLQDSYHLVIGSRYIEGGKVKNWSLKRKLISKCATLIAKIGLNIKQKDPMSGFFGFHKNILKGIDFDAIGYKILLEILVKNKNIKIKEIPISFKDRNYGKSKLGVYTIIDFIISVWKLYRYGKKIKEKRTPIKFISKTARFFTVGASGLIVNMSTIALVIGISPLWYIYANIMGILVSMSSNFILNKIWTFENREFSWKNTPKQYAKFIIFSSLGAAIQLSMVYYLVDIISASYPVALFSAVMLAGFGNFILNKKFTFNETIWS